MMETGDCPSWLFVLKLLRVKATARCCLSKRENNPNSCKCGERSIVPTWAKADTPIWVKLIWCSLEKKKAAFSNQGVEPIGMNTYLEKEALINIYFYL